MKKDDNKFAPIVLFVYNRPWHTKKTIAALKKNKQSKSSVLYIYSDGGKDKKSWAQVRDVRSYIESVSGFKEINLIYQEKNLGLAESIITGVTQTINKHGKLIVLEDDHVTSSLFLGFMNECLKLYEKEKNIWQVSGWAFPIRAESLEDVVKHKFMNCWGWGTWKEKWKHFEKKPDQLIAKYKKKEIEKFCLGGADPILWDQVIGNYNGAINSWAIFWHEVIYKNNEFYINPTKTLLKNIGIDGSGVHHGCHDYFDAELNLFTPKLSKQAKTSNDFNERVELFYFKYNYSLRKNPSYIFSVNLNKIFLFLSRLSKSESYIVYGAGTGLDLILSQVSKKNILFVVDSKMKNKDYVNGLEVIPLKYFSTLDDHKSKIILSPFGRSEEIIENLIKNHSVCESRFVSLDILT